MSHHNDRHDTTRSASPAGADALRNVSAFSDAAARTYNAIYLTALAIVRDRDTAADITQETFLRAWLKIDTLRDAALLEPWLARIARNTAAQWLRTSQHRSRVLPLISMEEIPVEPADNTINTPRQAAGHAEQNAQLTEAIMALPDDLRQAVLLHYAEDMSPSDIARINAEAPSTVTRRLDKARTLLRQHLESGLATSLAATARAMRPAADNLPRTLAVITAAAAIPAATRAQLLYAIADTPPPPMSNAVTSAAHAAPMEEAGIMKTLAGKLALAKGIYLTAVAIGAAAVIAGGAYVVSNANSGDARESSGASNSIRQMASVTSLNSETANRRDNSDGATIARFKGRFRPASQADGASGGGPRTGSAAGARVTSGSTQTAAAATSEVLIAVSGLVYDEGTSQPLENVLVQLLADNVVKHETTSTAEGRYTFADVPYQDPWMINAHLDGYMAVPSAGYRSKNGEPTVAVRISKGATAVDKQLPMVPVVEVSGKITNQAGEAIAGAPITWLGTRQFTSDELPVTTSTADGFFSFNALPFQQGYANVSAEGYAFYRSKELTLGDNKIAGLAFTLHAGATARGIVKNKAGEPLSGAKLTVTDRYRLGTGTRMDNRQIAVSNASGEFYIGSLNPGNTHTKVYAEGYVPLSYSVEVAQGEAKTGIEVVLDEGLTVEGRVVGPDGEPTTAHINIGGLSFHKLDEMGIRPVQKTNADGSFILRGFSPGDVNLSVISHNPERNKEVTVQAGDKNVLITMDAEMTIRATVVDSQTKQPLTNFSTGQIAVSKQNKVRGQFEFFLKSGYSTFPQVAAPGYITEKFEVVAPKGQNEADVTLEMGKGAVATGRVISAITGEPMPDVPVAAFYDMPMDDDPLGNSVTDKDGRFTIAELPGSKLKVKAMPAQPMTHETVKLVAVDEQVTDAGEIKISTGGRIRGKIVESKTNEPPQNAMLYFSGPEGENSNFTFESMPAGGTFDFPGLKPGLYTVGANSVTQKVDLNAGEDREIVITLGRTDMRGTITVDGETTKTRITARHLETNNVSSGEQTPGRGYLLGSLLPGAHEIILRKSQFEKDTVPPLHREIIQVPAQEKVQKDFTIP